VVPERGSIAHRFQRGAEGRPGIVAILRQRREAAACMKHRTASIRLQSTRDSSMPKPSAGLLLYRRTDSGLEVFLVHPGGPFWAKKDLGAWSIPKGECEEGEEPLAAALREFVEETSFDAVGGLPPDKFLPLGCVHQKSGKTVTAWAVEIDLPLDPAQIRSNLCEIEWPPRSGKRIQIPEVDRAAWFPIPEARTRILAAQQPFLDRLHKALSTLN
jgi:predicted NUDIX family NTP pyrophosphohydrolase